MGPLKPLTKPDVLPQPSNQVSEHMLLEKYPLNNPTPRAGRQLNH